MRKMCLVVVINSRETPLGRSPSFGYQLLFLAGIGFRGSRTGAALEPDEYALLVYQFVQQVAPEMLADTRRFRRLKQLALWYIALYGEQAIKIIGGLRRRLAVSYEILIRCRLPPD